MTPAAAVLRGLDRALRGTDALNLAYAIDVRGPCEAGAIAAAIEGVVARDPLLGEARFTAGTAAPDELAALAVAHLAEPLALDGVRLRAALWSAAAGEHLLLLSVHHAVADALVLDRIAQDLGAHLAGRPIAPLGDAVHPAAGRDPWTAPVGAPTPALRAACFERVIPAVLVEALVAYARRWRTTPFAVAVAAVTAVLARGDQVRCAVQLAGRTSRGAWRAPGPWYDSIVLALPGDGERSLRELVADATRAVTRAAGEPGAWAAPPRAPGPPPAALVVLDRHPLAGLAIPDCRVTPLAVRRHPVRATPWGEVSERMVATDADRVCFFRQGGDALALSLFYKVGRVSDAEAAATADALVEALDVLVHADDTLVGALAFDAPAPRGVAGALAWPAPRLEDAIAVDAVSPAFTPTLAALDAFTRDAAATVAAWGPR